MIYITHIRMSAPNARGYDRIIALKWRNPSDGATGQNTVQQIVDWIRNQKGVAKVADGRRTADVVVVDGQPPFLRTVADGAYSDNLLALPTF